MSGASILFILSFLPCLALSIKIHGLLARLCISPPLSSPVASCLLLLADVSCVKGGMTGGVQEVEDLIHLAGPLTEDAVLKTLHARFCSSHYFVSISIFVCIKNLPFTISITLSLLMIKRKTKHRTMSAFKKYKSNSVICIIHGLHYRDRWCHPCEAFIYQDDLWHK